MLLDRYYHGVVGPIHRHPKMSRENSRTFTNELDAYLERDEKQRKVTFQIPLGLVEEKRAKEEEDKKIAESRFRSSYRPVTIALPDPILNLNLDPLNDFDSNVDLHSRNGEGEYLSEFDLARIDERLRSLGIDPSLIDRSDDDGDVSTLDLSNKIEQAIQI